MEKKDEYFNEHETNLILNALTCPICEGIFRNPFTILTCNHTFCEKCLFSKINNIKNNNNNNNSELNNNKKCPKCNNIISDLSIIQNDKMLISLINLIFPELLSLNLEEGKKIFSTFKENCNKEIKSLKQNEKKIKIKFMPLPSPDYIEEKLPLIEKNELLLSRETTIIAIQKYILFNLNKKQLNLKDEKEIIVMQDGIECPETYNLNNIFDEKKNNVVLYYKKKI